MSPSARGSGFEPLVPLGGFAWPIFATALTVAAGWGMYNWLGGWETPVQKAYVVGASIGGLGVAVWFNRIVLLALYAALIVLVIYLVGIYVGK